MRVTLINCYCGLQTKLATPRLRLPTPTPDSDSHLAPTLRPPRRVAGAVSAVQRPLRRTPAGWAARGFLGHAPPAAGPSRRACPATRGAFCRGARARSVCSDATCSVPAHSLGGLFCPEDRARVQ